MIGIITCGKHSIIIAIVVGGIKVYDCNNDEIEIGGGMKNNLILVLVGAVTAVMVVASYGAIASFDDDFDVFPYTVGQDFVLPINGWQASGAAAYVTNIGGFVSNAVVMGASVALTNILSAVVNLKTWTDFRIKPSLGEAVPSVPTNVCSFLCYFSPNGIVYVAQPAGWRVCTNDIWGNTVAPLTNNAYARLSVFQDFSTSNQAVFLNDQLIAQDLSFVGTPGTYSKFVVQNTDSNCWLDNIWIHTNVLGLASNRNGDAMIDADEVEQYGHARRTLHVCQTATNLIPLYTTLQAAVNAWRLRDTVEVVAGSYAESLTLTQNVDFVGAGFTMLNLTVVSNTAVSFSQAVSCGTLTISGQVALAQSASLISSAANVAGNLAMASNATFSVAGSLNVIGVGRLDFTNAQFVANAAGVVMNGTFAISNTWGSAALVSMPLPFSDNFELYATNTALQNLKFRGWYASNGTVKVQSTIANSGNAVVLPDGTVLSNSITTAATKVWTDCFMRPTLGAEPVAPATNSASFIGYVSSNGYFVVAIAGGSWFVCSNQLDNTPTPLLQNNAFTRITVCQDLSANPNTFAVFIAGNLVAQGLHSPANINRYASFVANNQSGSAYLDDVLITTAIPSGLTNDLNQNGRADAYEINIFGLTIEFLPRGSIYSIR